MEHPPPSEKGSFLRFSCAHCLRRVSIVPRPRHEPATFTVAKMCFHGLGHAAVQAALRALPPGTFSQQPAPEVYGTCREPAPFTLDLSGAVMRRVIEYAGDLCDGAGSVGRDGAIRSARSSVIASFIFETWPNLAPAFRRLSSNSIRALLSSTMCFA